MTDANLVEPALIGSYPDVAGRAFLPVSAAELQRSANMIDRVVETFGIAKGRYLLLISLLQDGAFAVPFERALMDRGIIVTNADNSRYEAARIESIIRRFDIAAVAGVTAEVLDGLSEQGHDPQELFRAKLVWARPCGYERLRSLEGIMLRRWIEFGPAFGLECQAATGVHIDSGEWLVTAGSGGLVLDSRLARSWPVRDWRSGMAGAVERSPCACGLADYRVIADGSAFVASTRA